MSTTDTRAAFEAWHKEKFGYVDLGYCASDDAEKRWEGYQAATEAAKATGTAGELDANAEMAKVKRDVELMGVGFLVDGRRCSLDRITWFNRPGDTWLPPPPGYPVQAALQPMTMSYVQNVPDQCDRITWRGAYYHLKEGTEAARQPAPVADQLKLICAGFGWRTDGDSNVLADRIEHHIRDLKAGIKARDTVIAERDAALAATAAPVLSEVDERDNEIFELQKALAFWLPQVNQFMPEEMCQRIAHDAYLLVIDGNLPDDFKTAEELHWILPATGKVQEGAEMVCGNCMEPIAARSQP